MSGILRGVWVISLVSLGSTQVISQAQAGSTPCCCWFWSFCEMLGALGTTDCPLTNKYPLLGILQGIQVCHTIPSLHASTSSCLQNQYTLKLRSVCQHKVQPWPLLEYNFWYLQGNRRFYISDAYLCLYIFYFNVYFICTGVLPACVCTTFMPNAVQGSRCL